MTLNKLSKERNKLNGAIASGNLKGKDYWKAVNHRNHLDGLILMLVLEEAKKPSSIRAKSYYGSSGYGRY